MPLSTLESFPKQYRITKRREYVDIQKNGQILHGASFLMLYNENNLPNSRLGITVTRKVGNAVVRNCQKRCIKEFFRRNKQAFPEGYDIVIIPRPKAADNNYSQTHLELRSLADRLNRKVQK